MDKDLKFKHICLLLASISVVTIGILLKSYLKFERTIEICLDVNNCAKIEYSKEYGIPTVYSDSLESNFFAIGYTHAKDRLWAMHFLRLFASGRLSEFFGPEMLEMDKLIRSFAFKRYSQNMLDKSPEFIQAYVKGINYYAKNNKLPIEFILSGIEFEEWNIKDTYLLAKLMAFQSSYRWAITLARQVVLEKYGKDFADFIIPFNTIYTNYTTVINEQELKQMNLFNNTIPQSHHIDLSFNFIHKNLSAQKYWTKSSQPASKLVQSAILVGASNSFVVHGNYTNTGKPILASDPHLYTGIPTTFYTMKSVIKNDIHLYGATVPGLPYFLYGRNDNISWGGTVSYAENIDFYKLLINTNKTHYFYNGTWVPLKIYDEEIKIKKDSNIVITKKIKMYETHQGPVIFPTSEDLISVPAYGLFSLMESPVSIAWEGYKNTDDSLIGPLELMLAKNTPQIINALSHFGSAGIGMVFATNSGDIGYKTGSKNYKRQNIHETNYFRDGTNPQKDWTQSIRDNEMPVLINPEKGYIVNCNNRIMPYGLSVENVGSMTIGNSRADRADNILSKRIANIKNNNGHKISVKDLMELQNDIYDGFAAKTLPKMLNLINKFGYQYHKNYTEISELIFYLKTWDYYQSKNSIAATIFNVWITELKRTMLHKYYQDEKERYVHAFSYNSDTFIGNIVHLWFYNNTMLDSEICENSLINQTKFKCIDNLFYSLVKTKEFLISKLGNDISKWEYSKIHSILYPHSPLSWSPLKFLFQKESSAGGSKNTLNVAAFYSENYDYSSNHAANFRLIADMQNIENTWTVLDTGNSGDFLNYHYFDQNDLYRNGKYLKY